MAELGTEEKKAALVAKYRGTTRFKDALKIIEPDPQRREKCEYDLASALWGVDVSAKLDKPNSGRTPGAYKRDLQRLAKKLRATIPLAARAIPLEYQIRRGKDAWVGEELKHLLKETEQAIGWNSKRVKGSPPVSHARTAAADGAYLLLKSYGEKPPTRTRGGPWGKLASVLLVGHELADLNDYLRTFSVSGGRLVVSERRVGRRR